MLWLRILIWVSLAALGVTVVVMTFRGGPLPETQGGPFGPPATVEQLRERGQVPAGEMAYDRWRPGARNDPERLRQPAH